MTVSFPAGYKCDEIIAELYPEIERRVMGFIKKRSFDVSSRVPTIDIDDAIQEGRLALLSALIKFDFNKSKGKLESYVGRVLINTYYCMMYEAMTKSRVPHVMVQDEDGNWIDKPRFPISFECMVNPSDDGDAIAYEPPSDYEDPEQYVLRRQLGDMKMRMINKLKDGSHGFEQAVFTLKVNPTPEFLTSLENQGINIEAPDFQVTSDMIGKFLGKNKNAVDWAMHKIKKMFTEMAKFDDDFSDLFEDAIGNRGWPMVHMRKGDCEDKNFKVRTLKKRRLDPRPNAKFYQDGDSEQGAGEVGADGMPYWWRKIERYAWGSYVLLKKGDEWITLVIEGRFNPLTGEVFGDNGMREDLPVGWYKTLAKELNNG